MALTSADISAVYSLLQNALSQDESVRKPAEASLEAISNRPGFCSCLLEIVAAKELDTHSTARWLAAVYFKNSINRYWRSRRDSPGIGESEKPHLRAKLLELLPDENTQVAVQLALLISKVARFDYPRDWPELFPALLQRLQAPDILTTHRAYLGLNQVLKELSTKRLGVDQRQFAQITTQLFEYTWHHWYSDAESLVQGITAMLANGGNDTLPPEQQHAFGLRCERWFLCTKAIRRMMLFGFPSDFKAVQEVSAVHQVVPAYVQAIQSLMQCWTVAQQRQNSFAQPILEKACLKLMKSMIDIQTTHPFSFSRKEIMLPSLEFCFSQVTEGHTGRKFIFEGFLIQCMILLQNILRCVAYKQPRTGRVVGETTPSIEERKGTLSANAHLLWSSFFDQKKMILLCTDLVQRYFVLTSEDLEEWDADPESFHHEQGQLHLRDKLRPCAEALYLIMFEQFKEVLAPVVIGLLKQALDACPTAAPDADVAVLPPLLMKDACYDAVGIASYDLYDYMDFQSWYQGALALELANRHPNGRILRRRIAWLLGQWVSKIKGEMRRPVYGALVNLLGDEDPAVKLAACQSLRTLIDDVHFYEEEFVEFVEPTLQLLFHFMQLAKEFDTQLQVLNLVCLIVDRLGDKIVPCADKIRAFLPQVWDKSEGQSLLRIQVMLALQRLLIALGANSPLCYDILFPILQYSTDISQPDELNMLEDGMQLWLATLRQAPAMVPPLLEIFPHLVPIMERNFDHLPVAMKIVESYILLGGSTFLQHHGQSVVKILDMVVGNVNEKGLMVTLGVVDILIQCFPAEAPPVLEQVLQNLLVLLVANSKESDLVRASAAALLARVLLQNSSYFAQLLSSPSTAALLQQQHPGGVGQSPLLLFVDAWIDKLDSLPSVAKRKLSALALCVLLTFPEAQLLDRLEAIISSCTGVLHETEGDQENGAAQGYDYWAANASEDGDTGPSESECLRRRQVFAADPTNTMSVGPLLKTKLQACAALHGQAAFNAATSKVHPAVLAHLHHAVQ